MGKNGEFECFQIELKACYSHDRLFDDHLSIRNTSPFVCHHQTDAQLQRQDLASSPRGGGDFQRQRLVTSANVEFRTIVPRDFNVIGDISMEVTYGQISDVRPGR